MIIAAYIVLALAFGISDMILFQRCGKITPIRLSRGMMVTLVVAVVQTMLFMLGMLLGDLLRFELPTDAQAFAKTNAMIFMGLAVFVVLRMLMPHLRREPKLPLFNLGNNAACVAMAFATGINYLLIGLGAGFVVSIECDFHKALWPMLVVLFLTGYFGLMLGRRNVALRTRRWMIVVAVLIMAVAIGALVNAK